jgi:hypothetical protein
MACTRRGSRRLARPHLISSRGAGNASDFLKDNGANILRDLIARSQDSFIAFVTKNVTFCLNTENK